MSYPTLGYEVYFVPLSENLGCVSGISAHWSLVHLIACVRHEIQAHYAFPTTWDMEATRAVGPTFIAS